MEQQAPIFALDIGTRSVIGVILYPLENGQFEIKDIQMVEHKERSMLDGQIHDVLAVAETINKVKVQLEKDHGPLKYASVAAAGRSLKTKRVKIEINIDGQPIIRKEDVRAYELSAIQEAQKQLANESTEDMTYYHCVGYSIVNYFLDDSVIGSLIDQRGKKAAVEIIATFLPRIVVDSLISALHRVDLEMEALTLEPIAAIHVLIPPSMRKLNIAFVDIGAGTSDIAITDEGTIIAYGMVPVAGDEITEAISQFYLLDFHIAEEIKRNCTVDTEVSFSDILGRPYELPSEVIIHQIDKPIENLARNIADKIMELNKKPPQAVMLVGGGSQTPKLSEKIADILNLTQQRVAIRGADAIQQKVTWATNFKKGPELVTPIGIGISSKENPIQYLTFYVNGDVIHLFEMKALTVGDALIAAGIPVKNLFGKPGMAMTINVNGRIKMIPGEHGTLPEIYVNGNQANIDSKINNGDKINVTSGKNGKDATLTIKEALEYSSVQALNILIEEKSIELLPLVEINGIDSGYNSIVNDRDTINFRHVKTTEEALIFAGYSTVPFGEKTINTTFLGERKAIKYKQKQLYRNGQPATLKDAITDGDVITFDKTNNPYPVIRSLLNESQNQSNSIEVTFNGEKVKIEPSSYQVLVNKQKSNLDSPILPNSNIEINWSEDTTLKFSDVFRYIEFDTQGSEGKTKYVIKINNEIADFNSPIKHKDVLELYWE